MKKAIVNATVYPVTSPPVPDGVVVVEGKKIIAVGSREVLPPQAEIIEARRQLYGDPRVGGLRAANP